MTPFNLKIVSPEKVFFEGQSENVIVRTTVGDKGILARHEPYVAAVPIGKMRVMTDDGNYRTVAISGGIIQVEENGDTLILSQSCEWSDEIDVTRAEKSKTEAEGILEGGDVSVFEGDAAKSKLKRAENRLNVAG